MDTKILDLRNEMKARAIKHLPFSFYVDTAIKTVLLVLIIGLMVLIAAIV